MKNCETMSIAHFLGEISPFNQLPQAGLERLLAACRRIRASRGETVAHAEASATGVHVVVEGEVKRFVLTSLGGEKIIGLAGRGKSFGEDAALLGRPQVVTAQATRNTELVLIPTAALREALAGSADFSAAMTAQMAAASYELMTNLQLHLQFSGTQRVAHYLAQLAPQDAEHCEIRLETDKQTIAAQLNLTPETLSRVLARFTREGMIRPRGRRGMLLDKVSMLRSCATQ